MPEPAAPIQPLAEHLINQIAAGEVIERPASIVKELVENSIDAAAAIIEVEVAAGGVEAITVTDDGCGIPGAELPAALRRHWTSKLSTAAGLDAITSLGFRGEALASISAVADVDIVSRPHDQAHAWRLQVAAGSDPGTAAPARGNPGSRIEVRALFHHVPARRRFLKQPRTEFLHVQRLVRQLAFARPDIAFTLKQADTRSLRLRPAAYGAPAPRWQGLFGSRFCQAAEAVDVEIEGIRVQGWIGGPELAGTHSDLQFIALNGRVIRDRNLQHAVRSAYGEAIAPGRFPAYALALTVAPGTVDVNVHPGKLEVRFAALRAVHDVLHAAVRRALGSGALAVPAVAVERQAPAPLRESAPFYARGRSAASAGANSARGTTAAVPATAWGRPLALVDGRVLLCARDEAVFGFDLRAAWDEILQRRLALAAARPRPLLLPVRLPPETAAVLVGHAGLRELGFEFDDLGPAGAVLRAV
ncbi:MAG: DNA mismatch repair endonuclease MutL, partial [Gammaproteobacteria bacterium]